MPIFTSLLIVIGVVTGGGIFTGALVGATACVIERERTKDAAAEKQRMYEARFQPKRH